jgi:hypothetical protein
MKNPETRFCACGVRRMPMCQDSRFSFRLHHEAANGTLMTSARLRFMDGLAPRKPFFQDGRFAGKIRRHPWGTTNNSFKL